MAEKKKIHVPMCRMTGTKSNQITVNTPLTVAEQRFLTNYIRLSNIGEAVRQTPELNPETRTSSACRYLGLRILNRPNVKAELERVMEEARKETQASANEVMEYFTRVMRGEEKDQFGLDAPLSERTKAAQELAKRTIDIENRQNGTPDQTVAIKLDWSRD